MISYKKDDEGFLISFISLPENVRKIQRREFVRVPFFKKGTFLRVTDNSIYPFVSKDISAGGLLIISGISMSISEEIFLFFNIDDDIILEKQLSEIVRHDPVSTVKNWGYGVSYKGLPRFLEDRLVRYMFKLEQKMKEKSGEEENT
jgi:c-di-GMP-binding flagellar brake protein YcgR